MADISDEISDRLRNVSDETRTRVSEALRATLEREIAVSAGVSPGYNVASHSRGILFSRSTSPATRIDDMVLKNVVELDDERFNTFVNRLSQLRAPRQ